MGYKKKTIILAILALILAMLYIFYDLKGNIDYILPRRIIKDVAIILTGGAIAFSTTKLLTSINNQVLTPSVLGLDSLFMLIQTVTVFVFRSHSHAMLHSNLNYFLTVGIMVFCSLFLYHLLFTGGGRNNIYFL